MKMVREQKRGTDSIEFHNFTFGEVQWLPNLPNLPNLSKKATKLSFRSVKLVFIELICIKSLMSSVKQRKRE